MRYKSSRNPRSVLAFLVDLHKESDNYNECEEEAGGVLGYLLYIDDVKKRDALNGYKKSTKANVYDELGQGSFTTLSKVF